MAARISAWPKKFTDPLPVVWARLEGEVEERRLFDFFPDEITFSSEEFVGRTIEEAHELKFNKDRAYLRS